MPEDQFDAEGRPLQGTFFNYNDNILNNIGTFATNELLGVDDFQRAFGNFDRGDISFWDRLKAGATGVGELGTTASLFVPGANVVAGASKIPTLGKVAGKAAPFIFPSSKGEIAAGAGLTGLMGLGAAAGEDNPLSTILPAAAGAGVLSLLGARALRGRRAATTTPPGTDIVPYVSPAARSGLSRFIPKTGRGKLGAIGALLGAPAALAGLGFIARDDTVPAQPFVPTATPFSEVPGPDTTQQDILSVLRDARARERRIIEGTRDTALENFGQAERDALANYLNTLDIAQRGQTGAIRGQYQDLYDRLAGDVAAIEGMGAAGAQQVNRRYRQAARRAEREGRQERVASGLGGLTPVSGALADMPANVRGQGRDLATYLRNNAAVAARDAGFDAETSLEYGNAVANEFAQNIALLGAGQEFALESQLAAQERDLRSQYDAMLADLTREGIATEADIAASEIARQREEAASRITGTQLLADPELSVTIPAAWEQTRRILEGTPPEGTSETQIAVAQQLANTLIARYGSADVNTYAQFLADAGLGG